MSGPDAPGRAESGPDAPGRLLGRLDHPMVVVTTAVDGERSGCLVGFHTQCSIDPTRVVVFLSVTNRTTRLAQRAAHLAVHYLAADQRDLARLFGSETGDEVDKLADCGWREGPGGVPLLDACPGRLVGRILERWPAGDHVGHLLEPVTAEHPPEAPPALGFQQVRDLEPGHDP